MATTTTTTPTKKELQQLIDEVGERVSDMLNPVLTREELVSQVQELDALVNGADEEEEDEEEGDEEESDEDEETN
jgi:hypothetical protein